MKSLEHRSNSLNTELCSNQSAANPCAAAPPYNSFNKFSRSNGYYSQVLRVSWNIIGRWAGNIFNILNVNIFLYLCKYTALNSFQVHWHWLTGYEL